MGHSGPRAEERRPSRQLPLVTRLIATGLFSGYIPWASGTFGSALAVLIFEIPGISSAPVLLMLIIGAFVAGIVTSRKVAAVEGDRLTTSAATAKAFFQPDRGGEPDPSIVVIDEMVGMWITLFLLPDGIVAVALGFLLFRVLDVLKPPPAGYLERLPRGWGIMLDDVVAGLYANLLTRGLLLLLGTHLPSIL